MSKEINYVQCVLVNGASRQTAWIPQRFAVQDKFLKLKQEDDSWQDGWQVRGLGDTHLPGSVINERSRDYKHTRAASDI